MKLRFLFITVFPSTLVAVVYPGILSNTSVIEGVFYIADGLLCADGLLTVGSEVEVVSRLVIVLVVIVLNADVYPGVCNETSVAFRATVVCSCCPVGIIGAAVIQPVSILPYISNANFFPPISAIFTVSPVVRSARPLLSK